jgi:hypothetical protein
MLIPIGKHIKIDLQDLHPSSTVFLKQGEEIVGILMFSPGDGWAVTLGGQRTISGYYLTPEEALQGAIGQGYTIHIPHAQVLGRKE